MSSPSASPECPRCGAPLLPGARFCNRCGEPIGSGWRMARPEEPYSYRSGIVALLLCLFLGYLGIHRFYAGKLVTGLIWLATGGLFGIGWLVDLILIAMGRFRDADGFRIPIWD